MAEAHHPAVRTVQSLAVLLDLARRARQAGSVAELEFLLVNESHHLAPLRQAALWRDGAGITTLSGVLQREANAPYVQWLEQLVRHLQNGAAPAAELTPEHLPGPLADEWTTWWPAHALWLPMPAHGELPAAGLLLARDTPWPVDDRRLLDEWLHSWRHADAALQPTSRSGWRAAPRWLRRQLQARDGQPWWRQPRWGWALLASAAMFIPVRQSVMAPGELVPAHPVTVRAPMDGVLDVFLVQPNQPVVQGQPLFGLDEALIQSRADVAAHALATAETEYRQASQQALSDPRSKAQLALLPGKIEEKRAELAYLEDQRTRARVLAPQAGVALFDDPSEWIGRPVSTGERILRIAAPDDREVEAWLPIGDAIALEAGAAVRLYLSASPMSPVSARVRYVAHDAVQRPDGQFAYRLRATLDAPTDHRVGLKGTARVQGDWTPLIGWVLRRPLATLRTVVGL